MALVVVGLTHAQFVSDKRDPIRIISVTTEGHQRAVRINDAHSAKKNTQMARAWCFKLPCSTLEPDSCWRNFRSCGTCVVPNPSDFLPSNWFVQHRDDEPLSSVLANVQRDHCMTVIKRVIRENKKRSGSPSSLEQLADAVDRNRNNIRRRSKICATEFLAMAAVLDVDVRELIPSNAEWLAQVVNELSDGQVCAADSNAFARYCLATIGGDNSLCSLDDRSIALIANEADVAPSEMERKITNAMRIVRRFLPDEAGGNSDA